MDKLSVENKIKCAMKQIKNWQIMSITMNGSELNQD